MSPYIICCIDWKVSAAENVEAENVARHDIFRLVEIRLYAMVGFFLPTCFVQGRHAKKRKQVFKVAKLWFASVLNWYLEKSKVDVLARNIKLVMNSCQVFQFNL